MTQHYAADLGLSWFEMVLGKNWIPITRTSRFGGSALALTILDIASVSVS